MLAFLADYSVDGPAVAHPPLMFGKRFAGCLTDESYVTLDDWHSAKLGSDGSDLLPQIDGAGYATLIAASRALLAKFRIMLIESHWLPKLWNKPFFAVALPYLLQVAREHSVVHIDPTTAATAWSARASRFPVSRSSPCCARTDSAVSVLAPHPLDRPNVCKPPLQLPAC